MTRRPHLLFALAALLAAGCAGGAAPSTAPASTAQPEPSSTAQPEPSVAASTPASADFGALVPVETVAPAAPLDLTTHLNTRFDLASLAGHPVLIFFGYLKCPDVCPATFGTMIEVAEERPDVRVVYVTVDPERDTVPAMAAALMRYGEAFTGLTGTPEEIAAAAAAWDVKYEKLDIQVSGGHATYAMAHTADVFLVDPEGRYRGRFPFGTEAAGIVAAIEALSSG